MLFRETQIAGVVEVLPEPKVDERGFFARTWCQGEFAARGLNPCLVQCNISLNARKGTLRGMHYQIGVHAEAKLIRCTQGSIYDVAIDLRAESPTFRKWHAAMLSAGNRKMLYVPEGCAHGFLTLDDESEVFYQMSQFYDPESGRGVRWNDPSFRIDWPAPVEVIAERDRTYPDFK